MGVASRVTKMIANLGSSNVEIARNAEGNLIKYGRRAAPYLVQACDDPNPEVRFRAVWALGKIGGPVGFEAIAKLCSDPDDRVAYDAQIALGHFGDVRGMPILIKRMSADPGGGAGFGMVLFGERSVEELLPLLGSDDAEIRMSAAHLLARTMSPRPMPRIREIILNDAPDVAISTIDGIESGGTRAGSSSFSRWKRAVQNTSPSTSKIRNHIGRSSAGFSNAASSRASATRRSALS